MARLAATAKLSAQLAAALGRDAEAAWDVFLAEHSPLVLQVVHLFERDADRVDDCFLFVCERLRRDDLRRIRRFRAEGAASFPTWLRAVVRNLCLDWRRARFGRPRLPRSIARLPRLDQEVFRALHLRGLSEHEALHTLRPLFPALTRQLFDDAVARLRGSLNGRQSWLLLTRRPRLESLSGGALAGDAAAPERDLPDPGDGPEAAANRAEAARVIAEELGKLTGRERLLVRLRFEQELPLEQAAGLAGLESAAHAERTLRGALEALRGALSARGLDGVSVKGAGTGAVSRPAPRQP